MQIGLVLPMADGDGPSVREWPWIRAIARQAEAEGLDSLWAYDHLIMLNRAADAVRAVFGLKKWSFSQAIKLKVKMACTFVSKFEDALLSEAARRGLDGVVCGHVHHPELREIEVDGRPRLYANCGDWVERSTALVEREDGSLEILDVSRLLADAGIEIQKLSDEPVVIETDEAVGAALPMGQVAW